MDLVRLEGTLARLLRRAAEGRGFLLTCAALAFAGTASASFPVTAMLVPAALLVPRRWKAIAGASAVGSALGATLLVALFHHLGWEQLYERFPEMLTHASWARVMQWVAQWGLPALFAIAVSPLPQTPALIFFGAASQNLPGVFVAMLVGKLVKYGVVTWFAGRFPERFVDGVAGLLGRKPPGSGARAP